MGPRSLTRAKSPKSTLQPKDKVVKVCCYCCLFVFGLLLLYKLTVLDGESSNSIWVRLMVGICVRGRNTAKEEVGDQGVGGAVSHKLYLQKV